MNNKYEHDLFFKNFIVFKQEEVETLKIMGSEAVRLNVLFCFDTEVEKCV